MYRLTHMSLKQGAKVAVLGAGVSGLSFAHFLSKLRPDVHITLYDKASRSGGYIHSQRFTIDDANVTLEKGPRTLRGASDGTVLIADTLIKLGQAEKIRVIPSDSISNKKYLLSPDDTLVQVPNSWQSFKKFIKSPLGQGLISGVLKEPFQKKQCLEDESVFSFLSRRFGPSLPTNVISAVFHGVYAADVHKLSAKTTLRAMFEAEKTHGSIIKSMFAKIFKKKETPKLSDTLQDYESRFPAEYDLDHLSKILKKYPMITVENGLETFPRTLYNSLVQSPNVSVKLNTSVESITGQLSINGTNYDHIHTTINTSSLSKLLPNTTVSKIASQLTYIDIFMINIFTPVHCMKQTGFGYLIPRLHPNPMNILGVIFDSDVEKGSMKLFPDMDDLRQKTFPQLKPEYRDAEYTKLTVMMGGHFWTQEPADLEQTTHDALKEVEKHLGIQIREETFIDTSYIPQCLPQYHVGYDSMKQEFNSALQTQFHGHVTHGGMSFGDGAGVPDCVSNAYKNAVLLV